MPPDPVLSLSGWPGRLGSQLLCPAGASGVAQVLPNSPGLYPPDSQCSPGQHFHRRPPARGVAMATPSAVRQTDSPGTLRGGDPGGVRAPCRLPGVRRAKGRAWGPRQFSRPLRQLAGQRPEPRASGPAAAPQASSSGNRPGPHERAAAGLPLVWLLCPQAQ